MRLDGHRGTGAGAAMVIVCIMLVNERIRDGWEGAIVVCGKSKSFDG